MYWQRLWDRENRWIVLASIVFLAVQFFYSYLLWQRSGNVPPTPGDSFNYIVKIHQLAVGERFLTGANEVVNAGYNFLYGLTAQALHLAPETTYQLFFYVGKIALLYALLYMLRGLTDNKRIVAAAILSLAFFSGTGEAHGFFWVVPTFWMLVLLFLIVGSMVRGVHFMVLLALSLLYVFIHPIGVYAIAPLAGVVVALYALRRPTVAKRFLVGVAALIVAASLQLIFVQKSADGPSPGQLGSALEAIRLGVGANIDPDGNIVMRKTRPDERVQTGLLTWRDVAVKFSSTLPAGGYQTRYDLPGWLVIVFPSLALLWNGYLFYWVAIPWLAPIALGLAGLVAWRFFRRGSLLALLFAAFLGASIIATIHPQGHRFAVFVWPLTFIFGSEVFMNWWTRWRRLTRVFAGVAAVAFLAGHFLYSTATLRRIASYHNFSWNKSCASRLLTLVPPQQPILYSSGELAISAFIAYGAYQRTTLDVGDWPFYLAKNPDKQLTYVIDNTNWFYSDPAKRSQVRDRITAQTVSRQRNLKEVNCGDFSILREESTR